MSTVIFTQWWSEWHWRGERASWSSHVSYRKSIHNFPIESHLSTRMTARQLVYFHRLLVSFTLDISNFVKWTCEAGWQAEVRVTGQIAFGSMKKSENIVLYVELLAPENVIENVFCVSPGIVNCNSQWVASNLEFVWDTCVSPCQVRPPPPKITHLTAPTRLPFNSISLSLYCLFCTMKSVTWYGWKRW